MKKNKLIKERKLEQENRLLKKSLSICLNKPLIKELSNALNRINKGNYLSEKEFFKNSHLLKN